MDPITIIAMLVLMITLFALLALKVPISISIGISSLITLLVVLPFNTAVLMMAEKTVAGLNSFGLLAVPFFILAGVLMNNGGISKRLINFSKLLVGKIPGGLAHTNILGNMLFGSISGSSVAAASAMGQTIGPEEEEQGYPKAYSAAVNIASAPTGLIIPPTGILIMYSLVSGGTSISALFLAGYVPGILWGLACMIVAYYYAKKYKLPTETKPKDVSTLKIILDAIPALFLIIVVIGGILAGVFTATEASAIAVVYALVLSLIYKSLTFEDFQLTLKQTAITTSMILFLVAASSAMSFVLAFTGVPDAIATALIGLNVPPFVLLLLMNVVLLVIGTFMDITPAVLIFTPIFLPVAMELGMDPIQFGIMITMNLSIGNITPPVGSALFTGCSVAQIEIEDVIKQLMPFYFAIIVVLLMVTFIPAISLGLPHLVASIGG